MCARLISKLFSKFSRKFLCAFILSISSIQIVAANTSIPTGIIENKACIQCHEKNNAQLVKDWKKSSHANTQPVVNCVACHGGLHQKVATHSRQDSACIDCHGGKKAPLVHSYTSSKHGVIMQLEKNNYDWQQPLSRANYRAPGCSYCHLHAADHNVNSMTRQSLMDENAAEKIEIKILSVCQDCHAPRYITRLLANGESMLEIARKKVREATKLIDQASVKFSDAELIPTKKIMEKMQQHLRNVYLGAGHQSPDYQWWHGQPALDGDLLRIKGLISELHRKKKGGES